MGRTLPQRGFTIIEVLTVVTIITILVSLAIVSYTTTRRNSRDARRKSDVTAYAAAFNQYNSTKNSLFITGTGANGNSYGRIAFNGTEGSISYGSTSIAKSLLNLGFITTVTTDPGATKLTTGGPDYVFVRCMPAPAQNTQSLTSAGDSGAVWAKLESANNLRDVDLSNTVASCGSHTTQSGQFTFGYDPTGTGMQAPRPNSNDEKSNGYFAAPVGRTF